MTRRCRSYGICLHCGFALIPSSINPLLVHPSIHPSILPSKHSSIPPCIHDTSYSSTYDAICALLHPVVLSPICLVRSGHSGFVSERSWTPSGESWDKVGVCRPVFSELRCTSDHRIANKVPAARGGTWAAHGSMSCPCSQRDGEQHYALGTY